MITINSLKRIFALVAVSGAFASLAAVALANKPPCDVPVTSSSSAAAARSPEQPPENVAVRHNGQVICVPQPAADAHVRHGDQPMGPCTKPGKQS